MSCHTNRVTQFTLGFSNINMLFNGKYCFSEETPLNGIICSSTQSLCDF